MRILVVLLLLCLSCINASCVLLREGEVKKQYQTAQATQTVVWEFTEKVAHLLREGKTTRSDVIRFMGLPQTVGISSNGETFFQYTACTQGVDIDNLKSYTTRIVNITFNKDKVFKDYSVYDQCNNIYDIQEGKRMFAYHFYDENKSVDLVVSKLQPGKTRKKDIIKSREFGEPTYITEEEWYYIFFPNSQKDLISPETQDFAMAKAFVSAFSPINIARGYLMMFGVLRPKNPFDGNILSVELKFNSKDILDSVYTYKYYYIYHGQDIEHSVLSPEECAQVYYFRRIKGIQ